MSTVGFVGTGAMGSAMAHRLVDLGHEVLVHNRTPANANALLANGARWTDSPSDLAKRSTLIISCLRDTRAVDEVYLGPGGLVQHAQPESVLVEHGTYEPSLARRIAAAAERRSCSFLDIPVTGGPDGARAGTLTGMAGGDPSAIEHVRPVLSAYLSTLLRVGDSGRGLELKLINQLLVTAHMAAAAEAIALLQLLDLPRDTSYEILTRGWGSSAMLARSMEQLHRGGPKHTGVTIQGMREVQSVIESMLGSAGLAPGVFATARAQFDAAADHEHGGSDPSALTEFVARHLVDKCHVRRL